MQDASQLGELIGHLFLKMSEHSNSATAHINTHAEDINSLSHKFNKFVSDADTQFQDLHQRIPATAATGVNPPPAAVTTPPIQGMNPACNSRNKNFTFRPYTHEKKNEGWISWIRMFEEEAEIKSKSSKETSPLLQYAR